MSILERIERMRAMVDAENDRIWCRFQARKQKEGKGK
jgi:hypothetical protein